MVMEDPNREGKRTAGNVVLSTTQRLHASDEEVRIHEGQKKERLTTVWLSVSPSVANKRKRQVLLPREGPFADNACPSMHISENADESQPLPLHVHKNEKPKEHDFAMNLSSVPRKARSSRASSSRFTSIFRRKDSLLAETSRQKSPQLPTNGSSSPSFPVTFVRRSKTEGTNCRAPKVLKVSDSQVISDKEAEVAEALYALSRSVPTLIELSKPQNQTQLDTEAEFSRVKFAPPAQSPGSFEEAPKRMLCQVLGKQDEGSVSAPLGNVALSTVLSSSSPSGVVHSSVGESEPEQLERAYSAGGEAQSFPSRTSGSKFKAGASQVVSCQLSGIKEGNLESKFENTGKDHGETQLENHEKDSNAKSQSEALLVKCCSPATHVHNIEPDILNRSYKPKPSGGGMSESKMNLGSTPSRCKSEVLNDGDKGIFNQVLVKEGLSAHNDLNLREKRGKRDSSQEYQGHSCKLQRKEESHCDTIRVSQGMGLSHLLQSKNNDAGSGNASSCISSTGASSCPNIGLAGWKGGFTQLGYYGCGATDWPTGGAIPGLSADRKATNPSSQLAHAALLPPPVPKMKSCATHVYLAHYVRREQQVSQQLLWSAALCRAGPMNPNVPPGIKMESGVAASGTRVLAEPSPAPASGNAMAAHAQYLQAMAHESSFASWSYPFNGAASQASHIFGAPFFQHMMSSSTVPQLQPKGQEHGLPVQKQRVGNGTLPHASVQKQCRSGIAESREMLATSSAAMPSFDQAMTLVANSGAKPISKPHDDYRPHQQVHLQGPTRQQQQRMPQNIASMSGPQAKKLNQEFSQGYSLMGSSRRPVGPGPLGLPSVASLLAEECRGVLPSSCARDKNQQSMKLVDKARSTRNTSAVNAQDNREGKGASTKRLNVSKANLGSSPFSLHESATNDQIPSSEAADNLKASIPGTRRRKPASTADVAGQSVPFRAVKDMVSEYAERPLPGKHGNIPELVQPGKKTTLQGSAQQEVTSYAPLTCPVQHVGSVPSGVCSTPPLTPSLLASPASVATTLNPAPERLSYGKRIASQSLELKAQQSNQPIHHASQYSSVCAQQQVVDSTAYLQGQYKHALPPQVHVQQPQQQHAVSESSQVQHVVPSHLPDPHQQDLHGFSSTLAQLQTSCGQQEQAQLASSAPRMHGNSGLPSSLVHSMAGAVSGSDGRDHVVVLVSKADNHKAEYGTKDVMTSEEMLEMSARSSTAVLQEVSSPLQPAPVMLGEQYKPTLDGLIILSTSPSEATMASS